MTKLFFSNSFGTKSLSNISTGWNIFKKTSPLQSYCIPDTGKVSVKTTSIFTINL